MRLLTTVAALRTYLAAHRLNTSSTSVGLVPTMGNLHPGHLSLIERARAENALVVVTIFVNPLQFSLGEDYQRYPRTLEQDLQQCEQQGVDLVFAPTVEELYPTSDALGRTLVIPPQELSNRLCGLSRPGHFQGVATVVTKLFNLVQPERAYFGQKDAQQVAIIRQLVADLNLPVEIISCPIIRESSGLAYSSRNQYLTPQEKDRASSLYRGLKHGEIALRQGCFSTDEIKANVRAELAKVPALEVEYLECVDPITLVPLQTIEDVGLLAIAARLGTTRLIDNLMLRNRKPIIAIDGPAGAGKSTVTRQIAQTLDLLYLDTGAMYRAVTWLVLQHQIPVNDEPAIAELVSQCHIEFSSNGSQQTVSINNHDVTEAIRSLEVTAHVSTVAAQKAVRQALVKQQQALARQGGVVAEGRDMGTCVFPDAELKIFLTASVQARAKRRYLELQQKGQTDITLEQIEQDIALRDQKDSSRAVSPLVKAADAIEVITDDLTIAQVTQLIVNLYNEKVTAS